MLRSLARSALVTIAITILAGCGNSDMPELGDVSGHVTLDGKPVAGINVLFTPEKGRPAGGVTDAEGFYELKYLEGYGGCKVGPTTVTFDWEPGVQPTANVPSKYMSKGFNVEVKPGSNTVDFPLTSK